MGSHLALLLLAAVALGALGAVVGIWVHRMSLLGHRPGTFRCWVGRGSEGPWRVGLAQYEAGRLSWWPRFSLGGAKHWPRESLGVVSRAEADPFGPGDGPMLVLSCQTEPCPHPDLYLLLDAAAAAGVTSWLEARPGPPNRVI